MCPIPFLISCGNESRRRAVGIGHRAQGIRVFTGILPLQNTKQTGRPPFAPAARTRAAFGHGCVLVLYAFSSIVCISLETNAAIKYPSKQSLSPPRSPSSPRGPDGGAWGRHAPFNSLETSDGATDTTHREQSRSPLRCSSRRCVDLGGGPGVLGGSGAGSNKPQELQQQPSSATATATATATAGSTAALQRLGRLRARAEAAFKKLTAQLPRRLDPAPPPPAYKPLTPAFDLGTLRRQVATLQVCVCVHIADVARWRCFCA